MELMWTLTLLVAICISFLGSIFSANFTEDLKSTRLKKPTENQRPIIGIIAHEYALRYTNVSNYDCGDTEGPGNTYIPTSIVKWVESGGGRVVPILADKNEKYLRRIFNSVNGIIFPGGVVSLFRSKYAKAGRFLYKLAVEANDNGVYFPIWGECLGLQFIILTAGGSKYTHRTRCDSENKTYTLNFTRKAPISRLYGKAPKVIQNILKNEAVETHNHKFCVRTDNFRNIEWKQEFRALSTNYDPSTGTYFVSSAEGVNYPFYVLGFHPETNPYSWCSVCAISHSDGAIQASHYYARFLVNEARKNFHKFETEAEEDENIIYRFKTSCRNGFYFFPMK